MGCYGFNAFDNGKTWRISIDNKGRNTACPRRFTGTGKDRIDIGYPAIGNPDFFAIQNEIFAIAAGGTTERCNI